MESHGNWGTGPNQMPRGNPNNYAETWHLWGPGSAHVSDYAYQAKPGMTTGFHTYGVDIEPDIITWYFDRQVVWSAPSYPEARRAMYIMVDLAWAAATTTTRPAPVTPGRLPLFRQTFLCATSR